ncbi:MAG: glycosyltransferase family 2 protein [Oligoflexia bacterium]|nr:glycosyltransferase family 2 protein [Oligoflexia bacterium]
MKTIPVILSFNHIELTKRCVNSVLGHFTTRPIYLVHNGSQTEIVNELKAEFPQVEHLVLEVNQGFSGGANHGLRTAFSSNVERVLFVTNDTTLEKLSFDEWPGYVSDSYIMAPRIERRKTGTIDSLGAKVDFFKGKLIHHNLENQADVNDPGFYVPGTAFLISKKAWDKIGEFDASLGTYWDDVDYSLRARAQGVSLDLLPSIVLNHGIGKTCHGNPLYTLYHFHRNRRRVTWRHAKKGHKLVFGAVYGYDMARKIFKFTLNHDPIRLKFVLRALLS